MPKPRMDLKAIKAEARFEPIVEHYGLVLERKGAELVGLCPFHKETRPSFRVHTTKASTTRAVLFAPLTRYFGHTTMTALIFFAQAIALIQLAFASRLPTLAPMVVTLGAANGMSTLARATTIAELFGPRHYGAISGAVALGANGARALASVGAAMLQVALGSYERVFAFLALSLVLAGAGMLLTRRTA